MNGNNCKLLQKKPNVSASDLSKTLDQIALEQFFNGIILIRADDQIVYQKSIGLFGSPTLENQFLIGSISKQFTATIILNLVDKGLIELNKPISAYLPELIDDWTQRVTVKHLLNHTSGIIDTGKPLAFTPGTKFIYNPAVAYYLASHIAEKVSGKTYKKLLHELSEKAGLKETTLLSTAHMGTNYYQHPLLAKAFKKENEKVMEVVQTGEDGEIYDSSWQPGGGIISSANDLAQWNKALHNGKLLSSKSYQEMITPSTERNHPRYGKVGYGFGVQLLEKDGYLEISHSGFIDGYISTLLYYPAIKASMIMLENVSWDGDMKHIFKVHDAIRNSVRQYIRDKGS